MIGVSPAYFISRFGDRFTPTDVARGLAEIAALGFRGFQPEVFHRDLLDLWLNGGARLVQERSGDLDLVPTQFVAHFLMKAFESPESLASERVVEDIISILEIVAVFDACRIITVPLGPFKPAHALRPDDGQAHWNRMADLLGSLLEPVRQSGHKLALEILPSSLIGGMDGFLRLHEQLGSGDLGLNFDTGHAWASGEDLYKVPGRLGHRILGTHLCDHFKHENLSLRPGAGSIDWPRLIQAFKTADYNGSYDLEIICEPKHTQREYREGRLFIDAVLNRQNADPKN